MPPGPHDAVVLTSATAAGLAAREASHVLPVYAIGERTARAAREAGFGGVTVGVNGEPATDGAALGRALAPMLAGKRTLYPCAQARRPGLEGALAAGGVRVDAWPLYRTAPIAGATERLAATLEAVDPLAVLVHSPGAARALGGVPLAGVPLVCLSRQIADAVPPGVGGKRHVAGRPDDASLLALLARVDADVDAEVNAAVDE